MGKYSEIKERILLARRQTWDMAKDIIRSEFEEINADVFDSKGQLKDRVDQDLGPVLALNYKQGEDYQRITIMAVIRPNHPDQILFGYLIGEKEDNEVKKTVSCEPNSNAIQACLEDLVKLLI